MSKISYPFAAVPNQVLRGGHGAINIAVLAVMLSHGRVTASIATIAREIGCDRKSVLPAIRYWQKNGPSFGLDVLVRGAVLGKPVVYEIVVHRIFDPVKDLTRKRATPSPENGLPPDPKTGHKEEPLRRSQKNIQAAVVKISTGPESIGSILERRKTV